VTQPIAPPNRVTRVALLSGVCVRYDAISYSLLLKLELLRSLRAAGGNLEVRAFVQGTNLDIPEIRVRSLRTLLLDPEFTECDLMIYEYGVAYELFDSLFALATRQRSIGIYHNVTPLNLVHIPEMRKKVREGLLLRHNFSQFDHVACDSEFNRLDLVDCDVPEERLSVLPLPPRAALPPKNTSDWSSDPVEILFVGRLVKAKGIHDLLKAVALLAAKGEQGFRLTLAGSVQFSEPDVIAMIRAAASPVRSDLRIVTDADDATLESLYRNSSVLVIPSYHEGYCLPVLEAYQAGCQVVAYDAANLPAIVGSIGQLVQTGDVEGLARAIGRAIAAVHESRDPLKLARVPTREGDLALADWSRAVSIHLERHSRESYRESFLGILQKLGFSLAFRHVAVTA
jgi:glycosyltransferase involved in cell wall biosynthesis